MRSKVQGRRRRRRRRKNRHGNLRIPGYNTKEKKVSVVDDRHARDVNEEEIVLEPTDEKRFEENSLKTDENSVNKNNTKTAEKSKEEILFNWQKPSGQWQHISGHGNFDRRKRRRNGLFRNASLKYMVYAGELDNKMEAN